MHRKRLLLVAAIGFFTIAAVCLILVPSVADGLRSLRDSGPQNVEYALQQTELVVDLSAGFERRLEDTVPLDIRRVVEECGDVLREALARNDNRYILELAGVWGEYYGTPSPRVTEITVEAVFLDGSRVEFYFYQGTLEACFDRTDER